MSFIALFLPACISVVIRHKRNEKLNWEMPKLVFEYGIMVMLNVLLAEAVIVYVFKMSEITIEVFSSMPFFTKYLMISMTIAFLLPYIEEIVRKFIRISFRVDKIEESENDIK